MKIFNYMNNTNSIMEIQIGSRDKSLIQAFLITLQENQWNLRLSKMIIG